MTTPVIGADLRPRSAFAEGARDLAPLAFGVAPFGLALGAAVSVSDVPIGAGWSSGPVILAGSAQLSTLELLGSGAAPLVIVVSALVINARLVMYGAALAPWFAHESLRTRLLLALPLIDQMYLAAAPRFERGDLDGDQRRDYWFGGAVVLCGTWVTAQTVAIVAGAGLPDAARLDVAAPLALAGLLAKSLTGRPAVVAAAAAGLVAVVGVGLPFQTSIPIAAGAGVCAGSVAVARRSSHEVAP